MGEKAIVIGEGASARRAAAGLLARGWEVTLLEEGETLPGAFPLARGQSALATEILGAGREGEGTRGVWLRGALRKLPLGPGELLRLMPPQRLATAAKSWGRARASQELQRVIGGGNETRTYADWATGHFGAPVFEALFAPLARKRWGNPSQLSCNVARLHHAWAPEGPLRGGFSEPSLKGVQRIRGKVLGLEAGGVRTEEGLLAGKVFVERTPRALLAWLPEEVSALLRADAEALGARDLVEVQIPGSGEGIPEEVFLLDADVPFFRLLRARRASGESLLLLQGTIPEGAAEASLLARALETLSRMGLEGSAREASLVRVPGGQPVWEGPHLSRMRRTVLALAELGVVPVGPAGLHAFLDPVGELAWIDAAQQALLGEKPGKGIREAMRRIVEPPAEEPPERPRLAELVLR